AAVLQQHRPPDLSDLNWRRLAPLRDAVVHAATCEPDARAQPHTSAHVAYSAGQEAAAWLVAGWIRARIGLQADIEQREGALVAITLEGRTWKITASLTEHHVEVQGRQTFTMPVRAESQMSALAAELL